jgi:hypothetical protein
LSFHQATVGGSSRPPVARAVGKRSEGTAFAKMMRVLA